MDDEQAEALLAAAREGVDRDGLTLERTGDGHEGGEGGYDLSIPGATYEDLSEDALRDVLADHGAHVEEWYFWERVAPDAPDHEAFLRWVERADDRETPERRGALRDGVVRTWGQLRVRAALTASGGRVYDLRHVADAGEPVEDLDVRRDPLDARRLRKADDRGRYRPLSTAPTLCRGWTFVDLDPTDVVRAVEAFYPATIANWYREREGDLDVTHWSEAAGRQTGIYDVVDELPGEAVEWVAEACCVDSQCLKRREWDRAEGDPLDTPRGDGDFPCREPCSLVIAAARTWATLEREDPRTYEFELTPSEKAQIEAIVDAIAEGRTDEIREADVGDGANRYRARYLRAKRFEDGHIPPTGEDG